MYFVKQRAIELRTQLKELYPDVKFSITIHHHSSIHIDIMSAPEKYGFQNTGSFNVFYMEESFEGETLAMMKNIWNIANVGVKHFETGDYGTQPSFYVWMHIGKWDKKFKTSEEIAEAKKQKTQIA